MYYLVAGRWFSAPDFTGPWTFATPSLPEDFKKIPLEHDRSRVLASVPGTDQAAEAVLIAQIPQTARVNKKETKAPEVAFQGEAEFAPIEQTGVQRAVNTDKDIFKVGDLFYMCYQGVWFSGKSATGPWEVADSVPEQIYQIPPSSPSHHVTYVTIEDDDDDEWVTFAAAAGYTGMMVAWGCTMWGTGWYYPPYYGFGGYYPYLLPALPDLRVLGVVQPVDRRATDAAPASTVRTAAPASAPATTRAPAPTHAAPPPTDLTARAASRTPTTRAPAPMPQRGRARTSTAAGARPPCSAATTGPRPTATRTTATGTTTRTIRTDEGAGAVRRGAGGGAVAAGQGGNVYAGNDGNVYRREGGNWQKYDNGNWSNTPNQPGDRPRPTTTDRTAAERPQATTGQRSPQDRQTMDQLNRDSRARAEGTQRTRDSGNYRSRGSSSPRPGSYGGGGGRAAAAAAEADAGDDTTPNTASCAACCSRLAIASAAGAQTRVDVIAAEQARKAAEATPYVPSSAERWVVTARNEFLTDPSGFYPFFGSVYSGGGFTLGAGYRQFYGDRTHWDVKGLYSVKNYKLIELSTDSWGHAQRTARSARAASAGATRPRSRSTASASTARRTRSELPDEAGLRRRRRAAAVRRGSTVFGAGVTYEDFTLESGHRDRHRRSKTCYTPGDRAGPRRQPDLSPHDGLRRHRLAAVAGLRAARRPLRGHVPQLRRPRRHLQLRSRRRRDRAAHPDPARELGHLAARPPADDARRRRRRCRTSCCRRSAAAARCAAIRSWRFRDRHSLLMSGEWRWIPNRLGARHGDLLRRRQGRAAAGTTSA